MNELYNSISKVVDSNFSEYTDEMRDTITQVAYATAMDNSDSVATVEDAENLVITSIYSADALCNSDEDELEIFSELLSVEDDLQVEFSTEAVSDILGLYSSIQETYTGETPTLYELACDYANQSLYSTEYEEEEEEYYSCSNISDDLLTDSLYSIEGEAEHLFMFAESKKVEGGNEVVSVDIEVMSPEIADLAIPESKDVDYTQDAIEGLTPAKRLSILDEEDATEECPAYQPGGEEDLVSQAISEIQQTETTPEDSLESKINNKLLQDARAEVEESKSLVTTTPESALLEGTREELDKQQANFSASFNGRLRADRKTWMRSPASSNKSESDKEKETKWGQGYFKTKDEEGSRVGLLGSGRDSRKNILGRTKKLSGDKFTFKGLGSELTGTMKDSLVEGILTGASYQAMDIGIKAGSGILKSGYESIKRLTLPTFEKIGEKLNNAGSRFADWIVPSGPSAAEILDGMSDKDASEIIKALDKSNWLSGLTEVLRTKFLSNLSKTGVCYIDEKGTLKQRNIVDQLLNIYDRNPDAFLEELPGKLSEIEEIYKATALISKESINSSQLFDKLKTAGSRDQIRAILVDEFNVMRKPLVSLKELSIALSNDFIALYKTDRSYFNSLLNTIARSVERVSRDTGGDSITEISSTFIRNLRLSGNEADIRRVTDRLIIANVRLLNSQLEVTETTEFSEELDIVGANANMDNSPVLSSHGSMIRPEHLGQGAGWTQEDIATSRLLGTKDTIPTLRPKLNCDEEDVKDAEIIEVKDINDKVKSTTETANFSESFNDMTLHTIAPTGELASEPGFGVNAL